MFQIVVPPLPEPDGCSCLNTRRSGVSDAPAGPRYSDDSCQFSHSSHDPPFPRHKRLTLLHVKPFPFTKAFRRGAGDIDSYEGRHLLKVSVRIKMDSLAISP